VEVRNWNAVRGLKQPQRVAQPLERRAKVVPVDRVQITRFVHHPEELQCVSQVFTGRLRCAPAGPTASIEGAPSLGAATPVDPTAPLG
jgi:hypothetical protein